MICEFTVLGDPQGKGRPRFAKRGNFVSTYTPDKTVLYENLIKCEYERQCDNFYFGDIPLALCITAYYPIAKSISKATRLAINAGQLRPMKKPDIDNILKIVADSLNGVAYKDDAQIVFMSAQKRYGDRPRLEVSIIEEESEK
jgi:Holliday junction resolvase RusA-like endonuclease